MIKVVFFDAMGTLFYLPQPVGHHYHMVATRHGFDLDADVLDSAFRAAWKEMPARPATNAPRPDDDKDWWRELVRRTFEICSPGASDRGFDSCFEDIYGHFTKPGVWRLYPETLEVLTALRKRCRLAIISNFDGRLRPILGHLGILGHFEKVIISSEAGVDKPAPNIFKHALASMNVSARDAIHAGDDPALDWEAAAATGMNVYKLDRPRNSLAGLMELLDAPGDQA